MKRKIYKVLSVLLAVAIVLSCCMIGFGATAGTPVTKTYYLDAKNGRDSNDGLTTDTAFLTYKGAIAKAVADAENGGYNNADSTVYFKVAANNVTTQWYDSTQNAYGAAAHKFKLIITTDGTANQAFLGSGSNSIELNGPTVFEKLYFDYGRSAAGARMSITDSLTIEPSVQQRYMAGPLALGTINNTVATTTFDKPITFTNNSTWLFRSVVLGSVLNSVHDADVNIVYNNTHALPKTYNGYEYTTHNFAFGSLTADYTATFNKNVNFNFINAADVTLIKGTGEFAFGKDAAVNILNSTGKAIKYDTTMQAALFGDNAQVDTYVFNNNTGITDIIAFTEKAGEYTVDTSKYSVTATAADGTVYEAKDGKLVVPAGEYQLSYSVPAQEATYYVSANGSNDNDGTEANPFKTIGGALTKALATAKTNNYNYPNSTVYLKLLGTDGIDFSDATGIDYDFTLNISSKTSGAVLDNGTKSVVAFGGPAVLENLTWQMYYNDEYYLNANDFTIGSDVTLNHPANRDPQTYFVVGATVSGATLTELQEVNFVDKGSKGFQYFALGGGTATTTYEADLNLTYNAPNYSQPIRLSTVSSTYVYYNKNVNLNLLGASGITLQKGNSRFAFGANSAFQVINSTGNTVDYSDVKSLLPTATYIINNNSGDKGIISFTETAGKYKVNVDSSKQVVATSKSGETIEVKDGFLNLTQPGEYELSIIRDPIYKDYYVSSTGINVTRGTRPATAGTKENPVKTFTDVTYLIEQDGLAAIDVARVYFQSGQTIGWNIESESNPSDANALVYPIKHKCKVEIDSTDPTDKATIANYYTIRFCGDTTVKNVIMKVDYIYASMELADNNVTFEEGSEINVPSVYLWNKDTLSYSKDLNIVIKGIFVANKISLGASYFAQSTTGNINFYVNNADAQATFVFSGGTNASGPQIYDGNINIVVKKAKTLGVSVGANGANFNGALHILADGDFTVPYSFKQNFEQMQVAGGKWLVTNIATDDDFVQFGTEKGKLIVKGGATAYSRQLNKDMVTHTGGTVDLSAASGVYTVSDKPIDALTDDSHKMLYFYTSGGVHKIMSQTYLVAGETYIYEFGMYCNNFDDIKLLMGHPDSDGALADFTIISKEKVGNYYKVKAELKVPEEYSKTFAHIGFTMPGYSEGVLFDRTFYRKDDVNKVDQTVDNQKFYDGLDGVKFDNSFWGNIFTGSKGGKGITSWTDGIQQLKILNFDKAYIDELIRLANPDDGEWWKKGDIIEEEVIVTYAKAKGIFKDSDGNPIKGAKMALISNANTYTATTNAKGEFNFGKVLTGFYDLFVMDGKEKISTGFSAFLEADDIITFNVVSDISELKNSGSDNSGSDYETVTDGENVEEIIPSGNLSGTVYTPYLETVSNLKIYLRNIGEVVTDENGNFAFGNVPVGEYEIYTVLSDGSEYVIRKVQIEENVDLAVKLKYDPAIVADGDDADNGWIIWVIVASAVALVVVAGVICLLLFTKKKENK